MKLLFSSASPFVRKVTTTVFELGLEDRVELVPSMGTPTKPDPALADVNPLGKLPAMILDDGSTLYDSRVICEFLDVNFGQGWLFPAAGEARWDALRRQALADGILDAALVIRYETNMRPAEKAWQDWVDAQWRKVDAGLAEMDRMVAGKLGGCDIGQIAMACGLGYLDLRFPAQGWRDSHQAAAAWYQAFSARPSFQKSAPQQRAA